MCDSIGNLFVEVMFRWIQPLAITEQRCNDDFMLSLLKIIP